jgi:Tol biopolymer transport system component
VEPQPDVYIAEIDGRKRISLPRRLTRENWEDLVFSWTADSKAVLLLSNRDGRQHIFKQSIDQLQPELLVGGDHDYAIPKLSPRRNEVLYLQMPEQEDSAQNVQIRRVPLAGGVSLLVRAAPSIWNLQCANFPATLCVYSSGSGNDLKFVSFDPMTGQSADLSLPKLKDAGWSNWVLSPNGRYLAGSKPETGKDAAIHVLSIADDSESTIPLPGFFAVNGMDWAADGKGFWISACILRTSQWGFPHTCTLLNLDLNGKITPMIEDKYVHLIAAIPAPDGKRLALVGESAENVNVWLIKNFQ